MGSTAKGTGQADSGDEMDVPSENMFGNSAATGSFRGKTYLVLSLARSLFYIFENLEVLPSVEVRERRCKIRQIL